MAKLTKLASVAFIFLFLVSCKNQEEITYYEIEVDTSTIVLEAGVDIFIAPTCSIVDSEHACIMSGDTVDTNTIGNYVLTFYFEIDGEISSNVELLTVKVLDTTAPVLTNVPEVLTIGEMETLNLINEDITASDNYDGDITSAIQFDSEVFGFVSGDYYIDVVVSDSSGNTTRETITIELIEEGIKEIDIDNFEDMIVEKGSIAISLPNCPTLNDVETDTCIINQDNLDLNVVGTYLIEYSFTNIDKLLVTFDYAVKVVDTTSPEYNGEDTFMNNNVNLVFSEEIVSYTIDGIAFEVTPSSNQLDLFIEDGTHEILVKDAEDNILIIEDIIVDTMDPEITIVSNFGPVLINKIIPKDFTDGVAVYGLPQFDNSHYATTIVDSFGLLTIYIKDMFDLNYVRSIQLDAFTSGTIWDMKLQGNYLIVSEAFRLGGNAVHVYKLDDTNYHRIIVSPEPNNYNFGRYMDLNQDCIAVSGVNKIYVYDLEDEFITDEILLPDTNLSATKSTLVIAIENNIIYFANPAVFVGTYNLDDSTLEYSTYGSFVFSGKTKLAVYNSNFVVSNFELGIAYYCDGEYSCTILNPEGVFGTQFGINVSMNDKWILVSEISGDIYAEHVPGTLYIFDAENLEVFYRIENEDNSKDTKFAIYHNVYENYLILSSFEEHDDGTVGASLIYEMTTSFEIQINENNIESIELTKDGILVEFSNSVYESGVYIVTVTDMFGRTATKTFTIS